MEYNYREAIKEDIKEYLKENYTAEELEEENQETLYDNLFIEDSVTGNASGSYYCNAWKAEEAITHNLDLLAEALETFGETEADVLKNGAEWCDVTIRCYLLGEVLEEAITEALEELQDEEGEI